MEFHGARYIHILVPCPLGWGTDSDDTILIARLAHETGLFPVFEAEHGVQVSALPIRKQLAVEEYLKPQKRFAHLFGVHPKLDVIARIQERADRNIRKYGQVPQPEVL
jgi:pyruvate ferredoxin oxidoreductase beta subunit